MALGAEIMRRRQEQGLSLSDLARMAGISKGYLSQIEHGQARRPSARTTVRIAHALGASIGELLGEAAGVAEAEAEIPASLQEFAGQVCLPKEELRMLAGIRYRGRVPRTADDWRFIYEAICRAVRALLTEDV